MNIVDTQRVKTNTSFTAVPHTGGFLITRILSVICSLSFVPVIPGYELMSTVNVKVACRNTKWCLVLRSDDRWIVRCRVTHLHSKGRLSQKLSLFAPSGERLGGSCSELLCCTNSLLTFQQYLTGAADDVAKAFTCSVSPLHAHRNLSRTSAAWRLGPFPYPAWTDAASSAKSWWCSVCTTVQWARGFLTRWQMDSWWGTRGEFLMYHCSLRLLLFTEVVLEWDIGLTFSRVWAWSPVSCVCRFYCLQAEIFTSASRGHAIVQAVSDWPLVVEPPFSLWLQCGTCVGKVALGQVFLWVLLFLPFHWHSANAPYSSIHLSQTI